MNKLENTPENKARFFALYWGQPVFIGHKLEAVNENYISPIYDSSILELSPLSQISDEDVMLFFELSPQKVFWSNTGYITKESPVGKIRNLISSFEYIPSNVVDGLRSKGYALPFENLSVDDLVSYGWVRLKGLGQ